MTFRSTLATGLFAFVMAIGPVLAAQAKPLMIVGNDEKYFWNDDGKVILFPPGKDSFAVVDLSDPANPKIDSVIPLPNSIAGPPVNLAVHPSGKFALMADSVDVVNDSGALKLVPDSKVFVIDLTVDPPRLIDTITGGKQPSGLDISPKGDLALVANRADKSVSVLSIKGTEVKLVDTISFPDSVAHVQFTPDGKRALAVRNLAHQISILDVADGKVSYSKIDLPTGLMPYNVVVTPDSKLALTADQGSLDPDGSVDDVTVIDLEAQPPRVIDRVAVGDFPEGLAISPKGDIAVATVLRGSHSAKTAYFYAKNGTIQVLKISGKQVTKLKELEVGGVPEAIGFSPDGGYLYVGNYTDGDFSIFKVTGTDVTDTGKRLKMPGHPASARIGQSK
jgi:DNA-binding beta-propeller fold protein YncE